MTKKTKPILREYGVIFLEESHDCVGFWHNQNKNTDYYVGDANTLAAAAAHIPAGAKILELPEPVKADDSTVALIRQQTKTASALIAVGSGTVNDLCKYASFLDRTPYRCIATAPSMNGYLSANASISIKEYKSTLPAHAPQMVLCDETILRHAPQRLIRAGIGDILCRQTIQTDWLLSHLLLDTAYEPAYFEWLHASEQALINAIETDEDTIPALTEALMFSGLAMRDYGASAPASQGEHLIAHMMEMLHPALPTPYHGEAIAVTTLTMAQRQRHILHAAHAPQILFPTAKIWQNIPANLRHTAQQAYAQKLADEAVVTQLNQRLKEHWSIWKQQLQPTLSYATLQRLLEKAGCPTTPQALGWPESAYADATSLAPFSRDRFTFLDLQ